MADILLKPASAKPLSAAKMQKVTHSISVGNQLVHAAAVATSIVMAGQMQEAPSIALMAIIFGQINDVIEPAENNAMQAKPDLEVAEELPQKKQCLGL